jgi:biotin-dependent carboxylase-like uncharacterized protein
MIEVVKPGLSTTVQDAGRTGYYHLGIPPSGALDQYSLRAANLLVGNPAGAAALEVVYMGPELAFTADAVVAVAGASMVPKVNGEERPPWESFAVSAGDVLSFAYLTAGARAYVAVAGGIDVPEVLGSRSTYALGALGGFSGRPLAAGDRLPVGSGPGAAPGRSVPADLRPNLAKDVEVRVVMGLYDHRRGARPSSTARGTSPRSPTASGSATRARSWIPCRASPRSGRGRTRRTSWTRRTRSARSRCRAASSRSSCTATPSPGAAT